MTKELASLIDHTLLDPLATADDIAATVREGAELRCASVCVNSVWVEHAVAVASGSIDICTVIGFPFGAVETAAKVAETELAARHGAAEFDMVINLGWLLGGQLDDVRSDVAAVKAATGGQTLKVILETAALSDEQISTACELSVAAGADFVKTSTGYHKAGGASTEAISLMRATVGPDIGVKASGGIGSRAEALAMIDAGASRIGSSRTAGLVAED